MSSVKQLKTSRLAQLSELGQSVWLDYIRRSLITSGELKRLIQEDGLSGITSNPSIFEKAIAGSNEYIEQIASLCHKGLNQAKSVFEAIAIQDIQDAADILKPVYEKSQGGDGFVSLEVSPLLAFDTNGTIEEAKRLHQAVNRKNLMIKVPGTPQGIPAIKELIASGINVNVTLLFYQKTYEDVAQAYLEGLEELVKRGGKASDVASVASFFISRIDTLVDSLLENKIKENAAESSKYESILGKVAIANAKLTYAKYHEIYSQPKYQALKASGARPQRLLWASTSTKNPKYKDTLYIDTLIGKETVNTIPPATFDAFRDHGTVAQTLETNLDEAKAVMANLESVGISMKAVTDQLLEEGVKLFADAFNELLTAVEKQIKLNSASNDAGNSREPKFNLPRFSFSLPSGLKEELHKSFSKCKQDDFTARFWKRDSKLWTNQDESKWMDWLNIAERQLANIQVFKSLSDEIKKENFSDVLLLGMGGSSLCPEVLTITFGKQSGFPSLHVLDSTDPAQIHTLESKCNLANTLFIVSSKSGTTLEPNIYFQYFYNRMQEVTGKKDVGSHFIAITDPGSKLEKVAQEKNFRHIFHGIPGIGGRYSALSDFGMIPAAVMGINVEQILNHAWQMQKQCGPEVSLEENPGFVLGLIMGTAAKSGKDKLTFIASTGVYDLGAWLEQLVAESTGKIGKAIIPCDREWIGKPEVYGDDRLFVYLRLEGADNSALDKAVDVLEKSGQAIVRISLPDISYIAEEFFRFEFATAVSGAIIGINPFDQPDVEASKVETRKLTEEYENVGKLPSMKPIYAAEGFELFADEQNQKVLAKQVSNNPNLAEYIRAHFNRLKADDYVALLAFIEMNHEHEEILQQIRHLVRDKMKVATCLGFGPRFLHSTGQAYKGGPNSGVFLQITCEDAKDIKVPDQKYSFGIVKEAQARGDFAVLSDRNRRALRIHLGKNVKRSLKGLYKAFLEALH